MSELCDRDAVELAHLLATGEVSAREVLASHLARLEARNGELNAVVTVTAELAADEADACDAAHARGHRLGPLHGLPIAHKDTHATAGVRTTLGSPVFADAVPDTDALIVARARAAGAVMVGKTNTPELAAGSQTFNPVFGATVNPWDPARTCGGSSGGSAVAVATGMAAVAGGSDMGGSLRNPAAFCGVVGVRPSPGRVPTWPVGLPWSNLSVDGPMGRTVADAALMLSAIAGPDARAPLSLDEPGTTFAPPRPAGPGRRIAWSPRLGDLPVERAVAEALATVPDVLTSLGWEVIEVDPPLGSADEVFETLRAVAFEAGWGPMVDANRDRCKDAVIWNVEAGRRLSSADVARAERLRGQLWQRWSGFMERFDAVALPTSQVPPFPVELEHPAEVDGVAMINYIEWMRSCSRITVTSSPAVSLPFALDPSGLPIGLQLVGRPRGDLALLELAAALEPATPAAGRRAPLATH
ncbi:MAG: amidase family protein [Actinomycetota bacterium]|nr:amidase family protein [Actinomycetota bacterium]